jgi:hypothetical protein
MGMVFGGGLFIVTFLVEIGLVGSWILGLLSKSEALLLASGVACMSVVAIEIHDDIEEE